MESIIKMVRLIVDAVIRLLGGRVQVPKGGRDPVGSNIPVPPVDGHGGQGVEDSGKEVGVAGTVKEFQFSKTKILPNSCLRGYLEQFDIQTYLKQRQSFLFSFRFNDSRITEYIEQYWSDTFVGRSLDDVLQELWSKPSINGKTVGQNVEEYKQALLSKCYTVWQVLDETCKSLDLNQKMLLLKLQKEQGLLTKKDINEVKFYKTVKVKYPIDGACGVGYYDDGTIIPKYNGFKNQLIGCCYTLQNRFKEWVPGTSLKLISGEDITPENAITWACYRYTPHVKAQEALYGYWKDYFPEELMV